MTDIEKLGAVISIIDDLRGKRITTITAKHRVIELFKPDTTENKGGDNCDNCSGTGFMRGTEDGEGHQLMCPICDGNGFITPASPTKADKVESLAELADRKGYYISLITKSGDCPWFIALKYKGFLNNNSSDIEGHTYAEAEAQARAFLTGLDDVTGKGGR